MATETSRKIYDANDTGNQDDNKEKVWRGLKEDPKSGRYLVYETKTTERLFDTIDDAVKFMLKASANAQINKKAKNTTQQVLEKGQENIDGVKEVQITRKLVKDPETGMWKVKQKVRHNLLKDDALAAGQAYKKLYKDKFYATEKAESMDETDSPAETSKEKSKKESSYAKGALGKCANCGIIIYPPATYASDYWLDRSIPADAFCPCCGVGLLNNIEFYQEPNVQALENLN